MAWKLHEINNPSLRRQLSEALEKSHPAGVAWAPGQLQKQEALGEERLCLHGTKSQKTDADDHRKFLGATVSLTFFISDRRTRDLSGMTETILDCLVAAGALPDDNWRDVPRQIVQGIACPKGEERVEVEITFP